MDYFKTKEAMAYANISKSSVKRLLKDTLNRFSLDVDSPIEAIKSRTDDIRKIVISDKMFYWEFSEELLNTKKRSSHEPVKISIQNEELEDEPESEDIPKKTEPPQLKENDRIDKVFSVLLQQIENHNDQLRKKDEQILGLIENNQNLTRAVLMLNPPKKNE